MITGKIDTTRLDIALHSLRETMIGQGMDIANMLKDEFVRLTKTIVNFVPPLRSKWGSAKTSGEMAIKSELSSLFSEATYELISEVSGKYGYHDVNGFITKIDGTKLNVLWTNIDPQGGAMAEYHKRYRGNRGKIAKIKAAESEVWRSRVIVPIGTRAPYIKSVQRKVGIAKASLAHAASKIGVQFPSWISRHFGGGLSGISLMDLSRINNPSRPFVMFGSRAPAITNLKGQVQFAVNLRAKAITRRVKLMISGYREDLWRGMKAQSRAQRTNTEPQPEVQ